MPDEVKIGSLSIDIVSSSNKAIEQLHNLSTALKEISNSVPRNMSGTMLKDIADGIKSFDSKKVGNGGEQLKKLSAGLRSMSDSGVNRGVFVVQNLRDAMQGFTFSSSIATGITKMAEALEKIPTDSIEKLRSILEGFKNLQGINPESIAAAMNGMSSKTTYSQVLKESRAQQAATRSAIESWQRGMGEIGNKPLMLPPGSGVGPITDWAKTAGAALRGGGQLLLPAAGQTSQARESFDGIGKAASETTREVGEATAGLRQWEKVLSSLNASYTKYTSITNSGQGKYSGMNFGGFRNYAEEKRYNETQLFRTLNDDEAFKDKWGSRTVDFTPPAAEKSEPDTKPTVSALERIRSAYDNARQAAQRFAESSQQIGSKLKEVGSHALESGKKIGAFILNASGMGVVKKAGDSLKDFGNKAKGLIDTFKRIMLYRMIRSVIKAIAAGIKEGTENLYQWSKMNGDTFSKSMDQAATSMLYFKNSIAAAAAPLVNALVPALSAVIRAAVAAIEVVGQLIALLTGSGTYYRAKEVPAQWADDLKSAGGAAKELAKYLAPFDELNVLPSAPGGGGGGANNQLDYNNMFELAEVNQELKDKFMSFFDPFVKAWESKGKPLIESIKTAWNNIKGLIDSVKKSFEKIFENGTVQQTLEIILGIVKNITDFVGMLAAAFKKAWDTLERGNKLIQNIADIVNQVLGYFERVTRKIANWVGNLDFGPLLDSINGFLEAVQPVIDDITQLFEGFWDVLLDIGKWVIEDAAPASVDLLTASLKLLHAVFGPLIDALDGAWEKYLKPIAQFIGDTLIFVIESLTTGIEWLTQKIEELEPVTKTIEAVGTAFENVKEAFKTAYDSIKQVIDDLTTAYEDLKSDIEDACEKIETALSPVKDAFDTLWGVIEPIISWFGETGATHLNTFMDAFDRIRKVVEKDYPKIKSAMEHIHNIVEKVGEIVKWAYGNWKSYMEWVSNVVTKTKKWLDDHSQGVRTVFTTIMTVVSTAISFIWSFIEPIYNFVVEDFQKGMERASEFISDALDTVITAFEQLTEFIDNVFSGDWKSAMESLGNLGETLFVKPFKDGLEAIKKFWEDLKEMVGKGISFPTLKTPHFVTHGDFSLNPLRVPSISVSWYKKGGIVDGATLIGAGEAGAEAIVPLENNTGWIRNVARELNGYNHDGTDSTATAVDEQTDALVSAIMDATARVVEEMSKHGGISLTDLTKRVTSEQSRLARAYGR